MYVPQYFLTPNLILNFKSQKQICVIHATNFALLKMQMKRKSKSITSILHQKMKQRSREIKIES